MNKIIQKEQKENAPLTKGAFSQNKRLIFIFPDYLDY